MALVEVTPAVAAALAGLVGTPATARPSAARPGAPLPLASLSVWLRPEDPAGPPPLTEHHRLKARHGLPAAVVQRYELDVVAPVRVGDVVHHAETVLDVGPERTTRLGPGRTWTVAVRYVDDAGRHLGTERYTATAYRPDARSATSGGRAGRPGGGSGRGDRVDVLPGPPVLEQTWDAAAVSAASAACRDHAAVHHDPEAARAAGLAGTILSTPVQALVVERALAAAGVPLVAPCSLALSMRAPVLAGDHLAVHVDTGALAAPGAATVHLVVAGGIRSQALTTRPSPDEL